MDTQSSSFSNHMTGLIGMVNRTNILKPSIFLAMFEQTKCQCKRDTDWEVADVVWNTGFLLGRPISRCRVDFRWCISLKL